MASRAATLLNDLQTAVVAHNIPSKFMPPVYSTTPNGTGEYWGGGFWST